MLHLPQRVSAIVILILLVSYIVPPVSLHAATLQSADPLPAGCINVTPPGNDQPVCCISGFVYVEGQTVAGAEVEIENANGAKVTVITRVYSGTESLPYYRVSLSAAPLNVGVGETIALTARYGGHEQRLSYQVQAGGQQVDVVLASEQGDDYSFDQRIWSQTAPRTFSSPLGIAVNRTGDIATVDYANARVQVFEPGRELLSPPWGTLGNLPGQFSQPNGVAFDQNGNVYVADSGNRRIQKFDSQGNLIAMWGSPGDLDGQFNYPVDLDIDRAGNIYVSDTNNHRIQKFTSDGTWIKSWGTKGDGADQLQSPWGIAVSDQGEVFVADRLNDRVQVFNTNGDSVRRWGTHEQVVVNMNNPSGVALDGSGNVIVTDHTRVQRVSANGSAPTVLGTGAFVDAGVAVGTNEHIYVAAPREGTIHEFTVAGAPASSWGMNAAATRLLRDPAGIAIAQAQNGLIYVTNRGNDRVQVFTSAGVPLKPWAASRPAGIAADAAGNVYVAEPDDHRVRKYTRDGAVLATWGGSGSGIQFSTPTRIAVDSAGYVYVVDVGTQQVRKFTSTGVEDPAWSPNEPFRVLSGVAVDQNGTVYVTDRDANGNEGRVYKLSSAGSTLKPPWNVASPTGISVDSTGNVYITDTGDANTIRKFTSDGAEIVSWNGNLPNAGLAALAVDLSGKVYIVDNENALVDVFRPARQAPPIATITHLSATSLNATDTLTAIGMGQVSVIPRTITAYRWTREDGTVIGTAATLTMPADGLGLGSHTLTFDVQDNTGVWSTPVSKRVYVAASVGVPQWTMLLYLDGDYHDGGKLFNQFTEQITALEQHLTNPNVRVVILLDGPANGDTRRITIAPPSSPGRVPQVADSPEPERAMDEPNTLAEFVRQGQQQFPAQHYYLAIANHGQAIQGIGWDSTSDSSDGAYLTVQELGDALRSSDIAPIDVLHLDACSLNLLEVAYEVRDNVKTMIASQYLGWSYFAYDDYAAEIGQATTAQDAARTIVARYAALANADKVPYTLSALNLERSTTMLQAVDNLAAELAGQINNNPSQQATIERIRQASQTFDSNGDFVNNALDMYVDLVDWATSVQRAVDNPSVKTRVATLLAELNNFIITNAHGSGRLPTQYQGGPYINLSRAYGLSIFYPEREDTVAFDSYVNDRLFHFSAASHWKNFLQAGVGALPAPGIPLTELPGPLESLEPITPTQSVFLPLMTR